MDAKGHEQALVRSVGSATTIVIRQKSVRFNLTGPKCETRFINQLLLDELRQTYQGTCMDRSYVLRILRIVGRPAPRVWMPRRMNGEMTTSVLFEYEAELLVDKSEVNCGLTILHGGRIVEVTEAGDMALATCIIGDHTTATVAIELLGIVTIGMIVPIRVLKIEYPQNIMNNINVSGELLRPAYFNDRFLLVAAADTAELEAARRKMAEFDAVVARVSRLERSQYFKAWLYPYKQIPEKKLYMLSQVVGKKTLKPMFVRIDDACDPSAMQFAVIGRMNPVDRVTFTAFADLLIGDAKKVYADIEQLATVYADEAVFAAHKSIWAYYENAKEATKRATTVNQPSRPPSPVTAQGEQAGATAASAATVGGVAETQIEPPTA